MNRIRLSLLAAVAVMFSVVGAQAQTLAEAREQAVAYLEQCIASVPYGHTALEEGIAAVRAAATVQAVTEAKEAATAASIEEMRDDIYRIRITIKNVGLDAYMTVPGKSETSDEWSRPITFAPEVSHQAVWLFKYKPNGLFKLFNNDRFNVGTLYQSTDMTIVGSSFMDPGFEFLPEFSDNGHILLPYYYSWKELNEATGKSETLTEKRYLVPNAEGQLEYTLQPESPRAEWVLARAYESTVTDGPYITFDPEHPILYTLRNANGRGYLTANEMGDYLDVTPAVKEYSFWYFVDRGIGNGDYYIYSVSGHQLVYTDAGNYLVTVDVPGTRRDRPFRPFVMPGYDDCGLAFTNEITFAFSHSSYNSHCIGWTPRGARGAQYLEKPAAYTIKDFVWELVPVSGTDTEQLTEAKRVARERLNEWMPRSDFGQSVLQSGMAAIDEVDVFNYVSIEQLQADLDDMVDTTMADYIKAVNAELPGAQLTLRNVRRQAAGTTYMLAMTPSEVNTVASPTHDAVWSVEADDEGHLRFRTIGGLYLGHALVAKTMTTTTDPAQAGLYTIALTDGGFTVTNIDAPTIGLNADAKGSAAAGFKTTDAGSVWTLWRTAAIPQLEDGVKYTAEPDGQRTYYLIRNKANGKVIRGFGHLYNCSWGDVIVNAYWYLNKADNGDATYIRVDESDCYMNYNYITHTTRDYGRRFYLVPRGTTAAEGYYISISWPAVGACFLKPINNGNPQVEAAAMTEANKDQLTWIFEEYDQVDYQGIFELTALPLSDELEAYKEVQPWGHDIIDEAVAHMRGPWTYFGTGVQTVINNLPNYVSNTLIAVEEAIETDAHHQAVNITNVRRRDNNYSSGAHLAIVDDTVTTVADPLKAAWLMEYVNNGRYRLHMANTEEHLGPLPSSASKPIGVTTDYREAGLYSLVLKNGAVSIVNRSDEQWGVNIDMNGSPAVSYNSSDAGSKWVIAIADPAAIEEIEQDSSLLSPDTSLVIDLLGRPVHGTPSPGLYIVNGRKIMVK